MARDKSRDDKYVNCGQEYELNYVADHYPNKVIVYDFLKRKHAAGVIKYSTHMQVYELIKKELGYPIPI
jgi:hypothetical protein